MLGTDKKKIKLYSWSLVLSLCGMNWAMPSIVLELLTCLRKRFGPMIVTRFGVLTLQYYVDVIARAS